MNLDSLINSRGDTESNIDNTEINTDNTETNTDNIESGRYTELLLAEMRNAFSHLINYHNHMRCITPPVLYSGSATPTVSRPIQKACRLFWMYIFRL